MLSDREQIYDLMVRYGRAIDTADEKLFRSCFTDDVIVDYGAAMPQPLTNIEQFVQFFFNRLSVFECSHHLSNFTFEVIGDEGTYTCLCIAQHWPRGSEAKDEALCMVGVSYENRVRRTASGWRIARASQKQLWMLGRPLISAEKRVFKPAT